MKLNVQPVISLELNTICPHPTGISGSAELQENSSMQQKRAEAQLFAACLLSCDTYNMLNKTKQTKKQQQKTTKTKSQSPKVLISSSSSVNRSQKKTPTLHRHFDLELRHLKSYGKLLISKILVT